MNSREVEEKGQEGSRGSEKESSATIFNAVNQDSADGDDRLEDSTASADMESAEAEQSSAIDGNAFPHIGSIVTQAVINLLASYAEDETPEPTSPVVQSSPENSLISNEGNSFEESAKAASNILSFMESDIIVNDGPVDCIGAVDMRKNTDDNDDSGVAVTITADNNVVGLHHDQDANAQTLVQGQTAQATASAAAKDMVVVASTSNALIHAETNVNASDVDLNAPMEQPLETVSSDPSSESLFYSLMGENEGSITTVEIRTSSDFDDMMLPQPHIAIAVDNGEISLETPISNTFANLAPRQRGTTDMIRAAFPSLTDFLRPGDKDTNIFKIPSGYPSQELQPRRLQQELMGTYQSGTFENMDAMHKELGLPRNYSELPPIYSRGVSYPKVVQPSFAPPSIPQFRSMSQISQNQNESLYTPIPRSQKVLPRLSENVIQQLYPDCHNKNACRDPKVYGLLQSVIRCVTPIITSEGNFMERIPLERARQVVEDFLSYLNSHNDWNCKQHLPKEQPNRVEMAFRSNDPLGLQDDRERGYFTADYNNAQRLQQMQEAPVPKKILPDISAIPRPRTVTPTRLTAQKPASVTVAMSPKPQAKPTATPKTSKATCTSIAKRKLNADGASDGSPPAKKVKTGSEAMIETEQEAVVRHNPETLLPVKFPPIVLKKCPSNMRKSPEMFWFDRYVGILNNDVKDFLDIITAKGQGRSKSLSVMVALLICHPELQDTDWTRLESEQERVITSLQETFFENLDKFRFQPSTKYDDLKGPVRKFVVQMKLAAKEGKTQVNSAILRYKGKIERVQHYLFFK